MAILSSDPLWQSFFWLSFLATLSGNPFWRSFSGCPFWLNFHGFPVWLSILGVRSGNSFGHPFWIYFLAILPSYPFWLYFLGSFFGLSVLVILFPLFCRAIFFVDPFLAILSGDPSCLYFLAILSGYSFWRSCFWAIRSGYPSLAILSNCLS